MPKTRIVLLAGIITLSATLVPPRASAGAATTATPIMGTPVLIAEQLAAWYESTGHTPRLADGLTVTELARLFIEEGVNEGVRGDVAFAQSMFETGFLAFSGAVPPRTHNYAGIGAPNDTAHFPDARTGVRAQIQHLRAYGDPTVGMTGTAQPLVDPRFDLVNPKGQASTFEALSERWAPGPDYGEKVVAIFGRILDHAGPQLAALGLGAGTVGVATTPGGGAVFATRSGGIFSLAGAPFRGSVQGLLGRPAIGGEEVVAIVATPSGFGYYVLTRNGGVFAFGDAVFRGSLPLLLGPGSAAEAVDFALLPDGSGYYVLTRDGGIFAFNAFYRGSVREAVGPSIAVDAIAMSLTPDGRGYVVLTRDGGAFAFGVAEYVDSVAALVAAGTVAPGVPVRDILAVTGGYYVVDAFGGVFAFEAPFRGSAADALIPGEVVGVERVLGGGYRLVTDQGSTIAFV